MFGFIAAEMPDGLLAGLDRAHDAGKFSLGEFEWDMGRRTFWTLLAIGAFDAVANNASNQTVVQRYIAARSTREARKAVWISLLLSLPTWTFFYLVGTALWALYNALPDPALAQMLPEEVVPYFTRHYVPVGLTGLIVAAIMAASMSSMDSSINAISTIATTDVIRRYTAPDASEKTYLLYAKIISAVAGAAMIGIALGIANLEMESVVDLTRQIASIFGGVVAGIFLLAIFVPRVGAKALLMALPVAVGVKLYYGMGLAGWIPESWRIPVHTYWIGVVSNVVLMVLAYALSFVWPRTGQRRRDGGLGIGIVKTQRGGAGLRRRRRPRPPRPRQPPQRMTASPSDPAPVALGVGVIPPLATPCDADGRADLDGLARLVEHVVGGGVHGLFVLGTTGEGPALAVDQRVAVVRAAAEAAAGRSPLLVGITDASMDGVTRVADAAAEAGAAALVLAPPPYSPADAPELNRYLDAVAERVSLPLFLYDIPSRTGAVPMASLRHAMQHEAFVGFKDSSGRMVVLHEVIHHRDRERPGFRVLVGPEELLGEAVLLGADGGVAGGANLFPRLFVALYEAARNRRPPDAPPAARGGDRGVDDALPGGPPRVLVHQGGQGRAGRAGRLRGPPRPALRRFRGEDRGRLRGLFEEASTVVDRALAGEPS